LCITSDESWPITFEFSEEKVPSPVTTAMGCSIVCHFSLKQFLPSTRDATISEFHKYTYSLVLVTDVLSPPPSSCRDSVTHPKVGTMMKHYSSSPRAIEQSAYSSLMPLHSSVFLIRQPHLPNKTVTFPKTRA